MTFYRKCKPIKDPSYYRQFAMERPYCQFCGVPESKAAFQPNCGGVGLSRHHIVKFKRSDEPTNLIMACNRDHALCEGILIRDASTGELFPKLTLGIVLAVKRLRDPGLFDADRLAELYGGSLPDFEPIPNFLQDDWVRWGGSGKASLVFVVG